MAQFLRDLLLNGYNGVKPIETIQKGNNLGQQVKDVVSAELSKTGKRVLFYKQLPTLYGSDLVRISTKGSVDPARTLAVRSSRYVDTNNAGGGGFGRFLGNLLGGSANRPSDTIFPANDQGQGVAGAAPVSKNGQPINGDYSGLKYAVEAGQNYVVSQEPAGKNALTGLLKGNPADFAKNAIGAATNAAKSAVRNVAVKALTSKRITNANKLKKDAEGKKKEVKFEPNTKQKPGSSFYKSSGINDMLGVQLMERVKGNINSADDIINDINFTRVHTPDWLGMDALVRLNKKTKLQFIQFKIVGQPNYLIFPAAIGDITEDITSDISDFKYVGSPFKSYRYLGVERTLKFDFQVYWLDNGQQQIMEFKLNALRKLIFPNENLITIDIGKKTDNPLVFSPNLIQLSIGDLYQNVMGMVSNLSIGVAQTTTWATSSPDFNQTQESFVYPNVVDVSFQMRIIESPDINNNTLTYRFTKSPLDEAVPKEKAPNKPMPFAAPLQRYDAKPSNDKLLVTPKYTPQTGGYGSGPEEDTKYDFYF
jgi:hypothetical protein